MAEKKETLKKRILNSELVKEVMSIRVESFWKMLSESKKLGYMPLPDEEGATSRHDNEGAIFIPGGYVVKNAMPEKPKKHPYPSKDPEVFRETVREAMGDNATLLYHDGYATGQNLDNNMYYDIAVKIMSLNRALNTDNDAINPQRPPRRITPAKIAMSYTPAWAVRNDFGARTLIATNIAAATTKSKAFYEMLRLSYTDNGDFEEEEELTNNYTRARRSIMSDDGETVLAKPHILVCHTQRHRKETMTGITNITGYSKRFGEFSTLTIDRVTDSLMQRVKDRKKPRDHEILAEYDGKQYSIVLTSYPESRVGALRTMNKSNKSLIETRLVSPVRDLGMNLEELTEFYKDKYKL